MKHRIKRSLAAAAMTAMATTGLVVANATPAAAHGCATSSHWQYNSAHGHYHWWAYKGHYTLADGTHWHLWVDTTLTTGGIYDGTPKEYAYRC